MPAPEDFRPAHRRRSFGTVSGCVGTTGLLDRGEHFPALAPPAGGRAFTPTASAQARERAAGCPSEHV